MEPLLNRDDMNYEILNKIKVPNKSTVNMMNDEDVELTFYSITKKSKLI